MNHGFQDFTDKEFEGRDASPSRPALGRLAEASLPSYLKSAVQFFLVAAFPIRPNQAQSRLIKANQDKIKAN
jgi:hypothetical protein